jgi:hypothetical protein
MVINCKSGGRLGHTTVRLNFLRELQAAGIIDIQHIPGRENPADLGTKNLDRGTYERHGKKMHGEDKYYKEYMAMVDREANANREGVAGVGLVVHDVVLDAHDVGLIAHDLVHDDVEDDTVNLTRKRKSGGDDTSTGVDTIGTDALDGADTMVGSISGADTVVGIETDTDVEVGSNAPCGDVASKSVSSATDNKVSI